MAAQNRISGTIEQNFKVQNLKSFKVQGEHIGKFLPEALKSSDEQLIYFITVDAPNHKRWNSKS